MYPLNIKPSAMYTRQKISLWNINMVYYVTVKMVIRDLLIVSVSTETPTIYTSEFGYSSFLLNRYKLKKREMRL